MDVSLMQHGVAPFIPACTLRDDFSACTVLSCLVFGPSGHVGSRVGNVVVGARVVLVHLV